MAKLEVEEKEMKEKKSKLAGVPPVDTSGQGKEKKSRRITVKNASFFLYKKDNTDGSLFQIGSYQMEVDIRGAYEKALDEGILEKDIVGFKGRPLEFTVTEKKRKIAVR